MVKTEIILQTAERKLLEKDHEVYFKTGRRESIRKYLGEREMRDEREIMNIGSFSFDRNEKERFQILVEI